jgi:hypothetical protein
VARQQHDGELSDGNLNRRQKKTGTKPGIKIDELNENIGATAQILGALMAVRDTRPKQNP